MSYLNTHRVSQNIRRICQYSLLILLFFLSGLSHAQQATVTLSGKVTDEKNGQPLPFANVFVNNSSIGTNADVNGNYKLPNLPLGTIEIAVSFLGYETIKQTLRFEQAGNKTVVFKLREGMQLGEATVYAKKIKSGRNISKSLPGNY